MKSKKIEIKWSEKYSDATHISLMYCFKRCDVNS